MTDQDLEDSLQCGFLGWTEVPALGSNTYTIDETFRTFDDLDKVEPLNESAVCKDLTTKLYKLDQGYQTYRYHLSSSGTSNGSVCDVSATNSTTLESCVSQVLIRYGTFMVSSMWSIHGMEQKDMLIDIGAIVGAVAYITSYLTFFKE